ncbi:hypothetical protein Dimus_013966 [Dionaea muscipula]
MEYCEYIKEVWEESKYTKPLEITRRFANDENIMAARRVESGELKPFRRFVHFLVMKNMVPGFGKRDTSKLLGSRIHGPLDVREKDWLTMVFKAFGVPLVDKKGEEPKKDDFFEDTFLTMYEAVVEEIRLGEKFYDAEDKDRGSRKCEEIQATTHKVRLGENEQACRSRPLVLY